MELTDIKEYDNIKTGVLVRDTKIKVARQDIPAAEGSRVFISEKGDIIGGPWDYNVPIILSDSIELQVGENNFQMTEGCIVGLYPESVLIEYLSLDKDKELHVGGENWPFSCKRSFGDSSKIHFYKFGGVSSGHLGEDRDITIGGNLYAVKKLSRLFFTKEGTLDLSRIQQGGIHGGLELSRDCEIKIGDNRVLLPRGSTMSFYENGSLFQCCLKDTVTCNVAGTIIEYTSKYEPGPGNRIWSGDMLFHDNGTPLSGYLKNDTTIEINGTKATFPKDTQLELYRNGSPCAGYLEEQTELKTGSITVTCPADLIKPVVFHRNGNIRKCNPAREIEVPAGSAHIKIIPLSNSERWVDTHMDIYDYDLEFHENGTIACCTPGEDVTIIEKGREVILRAGKRARFREDGSLKKNDE